MELTVDLSGGLLQYHELEVQILRRKYEGEQLLVSGWITVRQTRDAENPVQSRKDDLSLTVGEQGNCAWAGRLVGEAIQHETAEDMPVRRVVVGVPAGEVGCADADNRPSLGHSMHLPKERFGVLHVLQDVLAMNCREVVGGKWVGHDIQVVDQIRFDAGIAVHADGSGVLGIPAAKIQNVPFRKQLLQLQDPALLSVQTVPDGS